MDMGRKRFSFSLLVGMPTHLVFLENSMDISFHLIQQLQFLEYTQGSQNKMEKNYLHLYVSCSMIHNSQKFENNPHIKE